MAPYVPQESAQYGFRPEPRGTATSSPYSILPVATRFARPTSPNIAEVDRKPERRRIPVAVSIRSFTSVWDFNPGCKLKARRSAVDVGSERSNAAETLEMARGVRIAEAS